MKTSSTLHKLLCVSAVITGLAFSPTLHADTPMDQTQNTKTPDSTADQNSASTGAPGQGAAASATDKTSSKDPTSLDKNPSSNSTDSANKSATKDPTTTTQHDAAAREASDKETAGLGGSGSSRSSGESEKVSDNDFLFKAAQGGMTEVELGKLAQQNGSAADVKEFGSRMVTDHSQADSQLKAVADKKGVTIPSTLDKKHQAMVDHLSHLNGAAFDHAYVHMMVKDHQKDVTEFREESTSAQDPDVRSFAGNTLPTVESHLAAIQKIQGEIK
jgi:putative membrane protein